MLMVGTDPLEVDRLLAGGALRCPGCAGELRPCCPSLILPMMASSVLPRYEYEKAPPAGRGRGAGRLGDGLFVGVTAGGQSAPVSEIAVRAAFSSTIALLRANAAVRALTARLLTARG